MWRRVWLEFTLRLAGSPRSREDEPLARYLTQERLFRVDPPQVRYRAFMPPKDGKTSVYRIAGLKRETVWRIGDVFVAAPTDRTILARGDVSPAIVRAAGLEIEPDNRPPRHASIVGWRDKDWQMSAAQLLAAQAVLTVRPE